jgi:hypothetical protein
MRDLARINLFMRSAKEDRVRDKITDSELLPHHHKLVLVNGMNPYWRGDQCRSSIQTSEGTEGERVRILSILDFYTCLHEFSPLL